MKEITKDHESITKDYQIHLCNMKNQCKKILHYISGHAFQFPIIVREYPAFMT